MRSHKLANFEITYIIENPLLLNPLPPVELTCSSGNEPIEIKCGHQVIHIPKSEALALVQVIERFREFIFEEEAQHRKELEMKNNLHWSSDANISASQVLGQRACGSAYPTVPAPYDLP